MPAALAPVAGEPLPYCPLCPRLAAFREIWRDKEPGWHNAPVPSFLGGSPKLVIVGLAPGLRGANRTGRPFTGDWAGDLLYDTLLKTGFARGNYDERPDDGLELVECAIVNAVRCVPPQNKPTPEEIRTCRPFLAEFLAAQSGLRTVLALGRIAHESVVRTLGGALSKTPFRHGARHEIGGLALYDSYHCSRYNTNTGVLTEAMFRDVFEAIKSELASQN